MPPELNESAETTDVETTDSTETTAELTGEARTMALIAKHFGKSADSEAAETTAEDAEDAAEEVESTEDEAAADESQDGEKDESGILSPKLAAIQRRDKAQRQAHQQRMAELEAKEKELSDALERIKRFEQEQNRIKADPLGYLREHLGDEADGVLSDMGEELLATQLGEDVPPEITAGRANRALERRLAELEKKLEESAKAQTQQAQQRAAEEYARTYRAGIASWCKEVPEDMPHVQAFLESETEEGKDGAATLTETLFELAVELARQDASAPPLQPAELAKLLEESLSQQFARFAKLYTLKTSSGATRAEADDRATKAKTAQKLTTRNSQTRTSRTREPLTREERLRRAAAHLEAQD